MPDENKGGGLGNLLGNDKEPKTSESTESGKPAAEVSEKEEAALKGPTAPGLTPAFGEQGGRDENEPLTDERDLAKIKEGSAASSGSANPDQAGAIEATLAGVSADAPDDGSTEYISAGIAKLKIGRFQFDNGRLSLKGDDVGKFEKALEAAHPRTRAAVKRIDRNAGEAVARAFLAGQKSQLSRGVDTSESGVPSPAPSQS